MGSNICITTHLSFDHVYLNREVLRTALVTMSDMHMHFDCYMEPIQPCTFRLDAYRQFTTIHLVDLQQTQKVRLTDNSSL